MHALVEVVLTSARPRVHEKWFVEGSGQTLPILAVMRSRTPLTCARMVSATIRMMRAVGPSSREESGDPPPSKPRRHKAHFSLDDN